MSMPEEAIEIVARAIWIVRKENEDRCDIELEDLGADHSVWAEASAAVEALAMAGYLP